MDVNEKAKQVYGNQCEWVGCGWNQAPCDIHYIDYQEHKRLEDRLHFFFINEEMVSFDHIQAIALQKGYGLFNTSTQTLPKNNQLHNLAVLCPNHCRFVHTYEIGMNVLNYIPARQKE